MLVTQALDERDLLVKKIADKIAKASFVDTIKPNEDKVFAKRIDKTEYAKEAESAYQQIVDLIDRFQKIDAAIVASNANTEITTSYGTFTVAGAIALRSRLRGAGACRRHNPTTLPCSQVFRRTLRHRVTPTAAKQT